MRLTRVSLHGTEMDAVRSGTHDLFFKSRRGNAEEIFRISGDNIIETSATPPAKVGKLEFVKHDKTPLTGINSEIVVGAIFTFNAGWGLLHTSHEVTQIVLLRRGAKESIASEFIEGSERNRTNIKFGIVDSVS